ncbi:hypothetical protein Syun_006186 [Stephania yunnanensis]|uniref:Glycosyltransferase n=1 Tax=Stephania yunnanensis TaxID=152371 RepID=A0AAP0KX63_9MAGN
MVHHRNHFIVFTTPFQGHINPTLQLSKRLASLGAQVTFVTSIHAHRRMFNDKNNATSIRSDYASSITFAPFSDGYDNGLKQGDDALQFLSEFKRHGSEALSNLIRSLSTDDDPNRSVTCLICSFLYPWILELGRDHGVKTAMLWIQPAVVFGIYYYYFNGYKDKILQENVANEGNYSSSYVELPGLPKLTCRDLPSFLLPSNIYKSSLTLFEEQFQGLNQEDYKPRVLINSFDALESEALKALDGKVDIKAIGPLVPSAFLAGNDPSDTHFGADLFEPSNINYLQWLNSKDEASVVYVSFGSLVVLKRRQVEEIARGLIKIRRPFLWVFRAQEIGEEEEQGEIKSLIDGINREEEQGLIVPWCSQIEVLSHSSVGCFVSHCGWNSTLESLVVGIPVVAFPQWTDQGTNAKLIEDVWRTGVRVKVSKEEDNLVKSEEIRRCVEMVMGKERGAEMRQNAEKWKDLARKAVGIGGSSERNLMEFLKEMGQVLD